MATRADHRLGFESLSEEVTADRLPVEGSLPPWLSGDLVRVTPAQLEAGGRSYRHWFDGLAMLNKFSLAGGTVAYASRALRTEAYRRAADPRARQPRGFATDPCRSLFKRVTSIFSPVPSDNTNVNLVRLGEEYQALSETPLPVVFDRATLATLGLGEASPGQLTTAHPHYDPGARELVNYATSFGSRSAYRVYTRKPGSGHRVLGQVPVQQPAYMHSFAMTAHYVVLAEFPLVVNPLDLVLGRRSFIESFRWRPDRGTRFLIVERATGTLAAEATSEPFFAFHHVNAFEEGGDVVLDICAYPDPAIIDALYLEPLRAGRAIPRGELRRYRIPLTGSDVRQEALCDMPLELPRIAYGARNGRPYRFVYGVGQHTESSAWLDGLVKVDVGDGRAATWYEDGCYPGEPVFVAGPGSEREDGGVVLSVVLDTHRGRSFLLVLDAHSFSEVARANAPHAITFGFHGQFFPDRSEGRGRSS